ncbi:MAG: sugar phosphate isomerase/epimerase [Clostridia bacterium]
MKISGRTQMLSRFPTSEILKRYKSLGFDAVEFGILDIHFHARPDLLEDYVIAHNVALATEFGLPISAVSNHLGYTQDDDIFALHQQTIPKIKQFGTDVYIIAAGGIDAKARQYNLELKREFVARTGALCKIADYYGVQLALEPEPGQWIATLDDFYALQSAPGCDNLKLNFDIGHAYLMEDSLENAIRRAGNDIAHCHLENMRRGEHLHLLPWEGEIDMKQTFQTLSEVGFEGALSLDLYVLPYEETAEEAIRYCKGAMGK